MPKPTIVITHERSGTHLLINCINYDKKGRFETIGFTSDQRDFNLKGYKHTTYKDIMSNAYLPDSVNKSHHQVEFMEDYLDFLFSKYKVIYVKRDIKDVLNSYYKFIPKPDEKNFPSFEEWVFSKPDVIGRKFLQPYSPDPHIIVEPENYIHRWFLHTNGWLKHKDKMLVVNYENMIKDYQNQKGRIESWIGKKIADKIPDVHDKSLPNFGPVKGKIGGYKEVMSEKLAAKIEDLLSLYNIKETNEKG
jgi:hypothetical protein